MWSQFIAAILNAYGPRATAIGSYSVTAGMISDTVDLQTPGIALEIFAAGDICFHGLDGVEDTRTLTAAMIPYQLPVGVRRIKTTGTTIAAANIKVLK
jgi:hypothetical protein